MTKNAVLGTLGVKKHAIDLLSISSPGINRY